MSGQLSLGVIIRSCLFWLLAVLALPFYSLLALLIIPLPARTRHRLITSATYYFTFLLKHIAKIKYQVRGREHIPQSPAIFAGNHQSAWETVVLNCILPPMVWIMKKEILNIPLFGWAIRAVSTIAIDRKRGEDALAQVISQGRQRFDLGFWIIMFPEGTRVKPGVRRPFKYGAAKLAMSLQVPIVPFVHNAGYCIPKNSFWLYPGTVEVIIGHPLYPDNDDPVAYTHKLEQWVDQQLTSIGS